MIDAHCGGPHCRIVFGGVGELDIPGESMLEKKTYLERHHDGFRRLMLREPRACPTTNVDLILPSPDPRADIGLVIMGQAPLYPAMSGGNLISVATVLLETGVLAMTEPETSLNIDTPAGLVSVRASCRNGRVTSVTFVNVASFATHIDATIDVPSIGPLTVDTAYGGMFYVLAEAAAAGLAIEPENAAELVRVGELVKRAAREQLAVAHPSNNTSNYLESLLWWGPQRDAANHGRNTVVISRDSGLDQGRTRGVLDRCPCGTGTSATLAVLHAKGRLAVGEPYRHEGILESVFTGRIVTTLDLDGTAAVIPEITGRAWIIGYADHVIHDDDPFPEGFVLGDL